MSKQLCILALVTALIAVPSLSAPSGALAQASNSAASSKPNAGGPNAGYEGLIKAALAEYRDGNWVEARSLFERAHELEPSARTLRGIGLAAFGGKDYVSAVGSLSAALADARKALTDEQRKSVSELLERATTFVARYSLTLSPADAKVRIDGREPTMADGLILLNPGVHELVVSAEGHEHATRKIDAAPRDDKELRVVLTKEGSSVAQLNPQVAEKRDGLGLREKLAIGIAAGGLASVGASVYFGLMAKTKADRADCKNGQCDSKADLKLNNQALTFGNVSTATAAVGGAALAAGALIYFVRRDKKEKNSAALQLTPALSATYAGALLSGSL